MRKNTVKTKNEGGRYSLKCSRLWGVLLFFILLLIDMVTKVVADAYFSAAGAPERIDIIPGWLGLCITYNRGISYGMGSSAPTWAKILVIAATGVMMIAIAILYFKLDKTKGFMRTSLVFVVAGGIGNFIDRVYYKVWEANGAYGVRDMVDLSRFGFAVCNFADFFICTGAVMLVLSLLFFDKDALCPVGKYKKLAKAEAAEKERAEAEETNG
ncbi:MAG: signal peptidase II [Clostridia bacterium]|nr:signal peptidase II [Clostridia bacterium]